MQGLLWNCFWSDRLLCGGGIARRSIAGLLVSTAALRPSMVPVLCLLLLLELHVLVSNGVALFIRHVVNTRAFCKRCRSPSHFSRLRQNCALSSSKPMFQLRTYWDARSPYLGPIISKTWSRFQLHMENEPSALPAAGPVLLPPRSGCCAVVLLLPCVVGLRFLVELSLCLIPSRNSGLLLV